MNVLAYSSQDPQKVGAKVEEKLREDLGVSGPIPYTIEKGDAEGASLGSVLKDAGRFLIGGKVELLFTLVFDIASPRQVQMRAHVNRQGVGSHVGLMLFSTKFAKSLNSQVTLGDKGKFTGDAMAEKLNSNKDLLKRIEKFIRPKANIGGLEITIPRICEIAPTDGGAILAIGTLGRPHAMGFKIAIDAKDFFDIAAMIEAML